MAVWKAKIGLIAIFCALLCFAVGCGSAWHGRIVHVEDGKVIIQPQGEASIKSGRKILIYRETTITHPVTSQVLGNIRDDITEAAVLRVSGRTITASVNEPWFSMMMEDDQVRAIRGSVDSITSSVNDVGTVRDVNISEKTAELNAVFGKKIPVGDTLAVIKYTGVVTDPDTGELLAASVEPVANLHVTEMGTNGKVKASYELVDEKLGWIESGDAVVKLTGNVLNEKLWFRDPPDGFSKEWIFGRSHLRAIRHFGSQDYREAILEFGDVIKSDPDYGDASYLLGLCYVSLNRHEEAAEQFEALLKRQPDDAKSWTALAYAYLEQEKLKEAAETYEKLANIIPGDPKVWMDLGDIYNALGNPEKSRQSYQKALEIDENNAEARYELQRTLGTD